jgi:hypothetical protein
VARIVKPSSVCPIHGMPRHRATCRECNAAYMRDYLWRRRQEEPDRELWRRAKKRADRFGIPFDLPEPSLIIPPACPVLGIPLRSGGSRSPYSPSLDRIDPSRGYVQGNVRVISDRANRLKGAYTLPDLHDLERRALGPLRSEYRLIIEYVEREYLLDEVRVKAARKKGGQQWKPIEEFLENVFSRGRLVDLNV